MPGLPCSYGEVTRLDLPLPFFLRDDPFNLAKFGEHADYDWTPKKKITLLVKTRQRLPPKLPMSGVEDYSNVAVVGCPLECPFDPNENFEEGMKLRGPEVTFPGLEFPLDSYEAMDLNTCRTLVKKIYEENQDVVQNLGLHHNGGKYNAANPIYMACDGRPDSKDLVMIGFDEEKFLELRMMGPYKGESPFFDLDLFLAYHQHLPNVVPAAVHKQVHAVYEKPHGDNPVDGRLFLEFVWSEPKVIFEIPPISAKVKVALRPKPGDANPHLKQFWSEVGILEKLCQLRDAEEVSDYNRTFFHQHYNINNERESHVVESIQVLIKLPSTPAFGRGEDFSNSMSTMMERVVQGDRADVDFTDKAWAILKNATTILEVWECFFHIFVNIEGKYWRPYLLPSNTTYFGKLLRDLLSEKLRNFRTVLTPYLALEMAIGFGILKLFRDYTFVLKRCHLAEPKDLLPFEPLPQSNRDSIQGLKKLHCLLEILCLLQDRLSVPMHEQEIMAQAVLKHFQENALNWAHTFHFDVSMALVSPLMIGLHPIYWNLRLESQNPLRISRTNAILSRDAFVCHANKLFGSQDRLTARGYYLYVHRVAQRRL